MAEQNSKGYQEAIRRIKEWQKTGDVDKWLVLDGLSLIELPKEFLELKNLKMLSLDSNQLIELPKEILELKNLEGLILTNNLLSELPKKISELKSLKWLELTNNHLSEVPKEILELKNLQRLTLSNHELNEFSSNKLYELPKEISELKNLRVLYLTNNQLIELPKEILNLKNLRVLYLNNNQLIELPKEISELKSLQDLYLTNNQLIELPKEILNLKNLQVLHLENNPKLNIPNEILGSSHEPQTILNYYFENVYQVSEEEKRPLKEVKVLLVGQGRVGKTSLVRYLVEGEKRDPLEETTHGIYRTPWEIDVVEAETGENHDVKLNLWDFGGQDIMHATHEFFLTQRSLYLYVMDAGLSKEANRLEYWLKKIQTYGKNAPVFIVINKSEANKLEIPLNTLQEEYNIQGLFEVSCENGFNIDVLKEKVIGQIGKMSEVFRRLNKNWFAVKDELETLPKDYITIERYRQICLKHKVEDRISQDTLLGYLNDLGVMLNFKEDNTKVLNPEWVTRGVYKLITSQIVRNNKAILTPEIMEREMELLNYELTNEGKEYLCYPPEKHEYIIKLMKKFELCYEIKGELNFYIPGRLEEDKPADIGVWNETECLGFGYNYGQGFLHESVMSRFIVKTHPLIFDGKQWLTGVVLKNDKGNKALVRADISQGFVKILIDGNQTSRREFLAVIRNHFQAIHADIKINKPIEEVQLDKFPDKFVEYEKLLQLESANINENYENVDGELIKVEVNKLLNGFTSIERRREDRATLEKIREEAKTYQDGLLEGIAQREPLAVNVNVFHYSQERESKPLETRTSSEDFAKLQRIETKKEFIAVQAESTGGKKAVALIIASVMTHILSFAALVWLIFVFTQDGWNVYEKWTFAIFVGLEVLNLFGSLCFFIKTKVDFSWSAFYTLMIEREEEKLYKKHEIDLAERLTRD